MQHVYTSFSFDSPSITDVTKKTDIPHVATGRPNFKNSNPMLMFPVSAVIRGYDVK